MDEQNFKNKREISIKQNLTKIDKISIKFALLFWRQIPKWFPNLSIWLYK